MKKTFLLGYGLCVMTLVTAQVTGKEQPAANASVEQMVAAERMLAVAPQDLENTLLWQISGNGLTRPSYLFGTMHILCADDARLSDNLKEVIRNSDLIYFEIDMDNMFEMLGAMKHLRMRNNVKLADLLTADEYGRVKTYFEKKRTPIPFSMMENFKPFFLSSLISEQKMSCPEKGGMEMTIINESKQYRKEIKGLESVAFQASVFDSIPYDQQAKELVKAIDSADKNDLLTDELVDVYKRQDLKKIEELTNKEEGGLSGFMNLLLYNRNSDWAGKMQGIMEGNAVLFAVGAAHLPGEKGVINLLRQKGYVVKPMPNTLTRFQ